MVLDMAGRRSVLQVPLTAKAGHLRLHTLQLAQLPQGPGAAGADQLVPDAWTILLWAVERCAGGLR